MKKIAMITMSVLFSLVANNIHAQSKSQVQENQIKKEIRTERKALRKLEGSIVSQSTKNSFYSKFGNMPNVKWRRDAYFDVASFTDKGKIMEAFYDYDANLVGTTTVKSFADLPSNAQKEIKTKYKDYSIAHVIHFDDNEWNDTDMFLYGTQFDDADNYFVELVKGKDKIVVRVDEPGFVYFFSKI